MSTGVWSLSWTKEAGWGRGAATAAGANTTELAVCARCVGSSGDESEVAAVFKLCKRSSIRHTGSATNNKVRERPGSISITSPLGAARDLCLGAII